MQTNNSSSSTQVDISDAAMQIDDLDTTCVEEDTGPLAFGTKEVKTD